jgi:MFS family permease
VIALGFAIDGIYTVLLNLYMLRLGYGTELIGLVNAVGLVAFAVMSLPAGIIGSRFSTTLTLKLGTLLICVGASLLSLVEFVPVAIQHVWLLSVYGVTLSGFSVFFVNGAPFIINAVSDDDKNNAFAMQTALLAFAGGLGSIVAGIVPELLARIQGLTLDDPAPYRITFMITAVVLIAAFALMLTIRMPQVSGDVSDDMPDVVIPDVAVWTLPTLMLIGVMTVVRLFQVAGSATIIIYFNVYMDTQLFVTTGVIGAIAALGRLIGIPTALLTPYLVKRWGNINVIIWSAIATSLCMLPLALVENWVAAAIGFIGATAMNSIRFTAFLVYIMGLVSRKQQAIMSGTGEMAGGISFSTMALGGGIILSLFSFRDLFLLGSGLTLFGTVIFWAHHRLTLPKPKIKPAI